MPFLNYSSKESNRDMDLNLYRPVEVIVTHALDGRLKPLYIKYIETDESQYTVAIDVLNYNEKYSVIEYQCRGFNNSSSISKDFILVYFIREHRWAIKKQKK